MANEFQTLLEFVNYPNIVQLLGLSDIQLSPLGASELIIMSTFKYWIKIEMAMSTPNANVVKANFSKSAEF